MGVDSKVRDEIYGYVLTNWLKLRTVNCFLEKEPPLLVLPELVDYQFKLHYYPHAPSDEAQENIEKVTK